VDSSHRFERQASPLSSDEAGAPDEVWWDDLDVAVIACLEAQGAMAPHQIGDHLGLSESAAASLVCLLAMEGRIRIRLVEPVSTRAADTHAA
jgi:hypothetical protein